MLAEWWAYAGTPCRPLARRLGYLREAIAIGARYRRCHAAWQAHLRHSRQALLETAATCSRHRTALILGSGHLLDVPLAELAERFQRMLLVDVLHPRSARRQAHRYGNVQLIEHDLTECAAAVAALPRDAAAATIAALGQTQPARFLDEDGIDLVASVNLLSQLPLVPAHWLLQRYPNHPESLFNQLAWQWMLRHLEYLQRFDATVCLIADAEQITLGPAQAVVEHTDYSALPWPDAAPLGQWWWDIAPRGEAGPGLSSRHRVLASAWRNSEPG